MPRLADRLALTVFVQVYAEVAATNASSDRPHLKPVHPFMSNFSLISHFEKFALRVNDPQTNAQASRRAALRTSC